AALFAGACALGVWQIHRLAWKRNLIAQVETRAHAPATPAPVPADWPGLSNANAEYRRLDGGGTVLVNRGFVLPEWRRQQSAGDAARP
ncbi:SURF1 family protein, partial [Bordetella pertussis]|uniref:SURF1 family protein n=1 Tax=Bordetella pertussis TaxID=520 RepID=UPI001C9E5745